MASFAPPTRTVPRWSPPDAGSVFEEDDSDASPKDNDMVPAAAIRSMPSMRRGAPLVSGVQSVPKMALKSAPAKLFGGTGLAAAAAAVEQVQESEVCEQLFRTSMNLRDEEASRQKENVSPSAAPGSDAAKQAAASAATSRAASAAATATQARPQHAMQEVLAAKPAAPMQGEDEEEDMVPSPGVEGVLCTGGHILRRHLAHCEGFKCDMCNKPVSQGSLLWGCRTCNFDLCGPCHRDWSALCPGGHLVAAHCTPSEGYTCDVCNSSFPGKTFLWGCRTCNFDMCHRCLCSRPRSVPSLEASLPEGSLDGVILKPGSSKQILKMLPQLLKGEPPNEAGLKPDRVGQFHGFADGTYPQRILSVDAVLQMLALAHGFWDASPNILRLTVPAHGRLSIIGDLHGQLNDLLWIFFKYGVPSATNKYLFLGDLVDRGGHSIEILMLLLALKRDNPDDVHMIRGNHEDANLASIYGFQAELDSKFGEGPNAGGKIFNACCETVFPMMPIAALVSETMGSGGSPPRSVCCMHGGVPPPHRLPTGRLQPVELLVDLESPVLNRRKACITSRYTAAEQTFFNMLWGDPLQPDEVRTGSNGRGYQFSEEDTAAFCMVNKLSQIVRAHQPPDHLGFESAGACTMHHNRCITVFAASNYLGNLGNRGGILVCDGVDCISRGLLIFEHFAPGWAELAEILQRHGDEALEVREDVAIEVEERVEPEARAAAAKAKLKQIELEAIRQICRYKDTLCQAMLDNDATQKCVLPLELWAAIMAQQLPQMPDVWLDLAEEWQLPDPVPFVALLHRFRVVAEGKHHFDPMRLLAGLRAELSDVAAADVLNSLDSNNDGAVTLAGFRRFLGNHGASVSPGQAAAVYEAIICTLGRQCGSETPGAPPSVHDVATAIALASEEACSNPVGEGWGQVAQNLGDAIVRSGQTLVDFFVGADTDGDGFLTLPELQEVVLKGPGQKFSTEEMKNLMRHMDAQGTQDGVVSLLEFLRAAGPRRLAQELASALLGEVLRPLLFYHAGLLAFLQQCCDPAATGVVSEVHFRCGVQEMQRQLAANGEPQLTPSQVDLVSEIASGGTGRVHYRQFLQNLTVMDTSQECPPTSPLHLHMPTPILAA